MLFCLIYFWAFLFFSLSLFLSSLIFFLKSWVFFLEFSVLELWGSSIELVLYFDWMSLLFMSFVLFISSMILNYSSEYMSGDLNLKRFIYLMIMFVLSMMMLILNMNLISILLGWDGLGLVSYALVVYYQNFKSNSAGMLTALSNRIGDAAILVSIAWMGQYESFNFLLYLEFLSMEKVFYLVLMLIILAAMTKSAQIPFSSWLPAAMAAPTPVSSLVHSSTLVTAGVYFLIRVSLSFSCELENFLLFVSLFTMFMSGLAANLEYDLKKIIALSTLSQLGLMITILSLGSFEMAFMHLLIHALFKALLFMCAGAIIHNLGDIQDIRMMGSLSYYLPLTCACMNISNIALCGLPFMSGFYSKDLIAEVLSMKFSSWLVYFIFYFSIGLTVSYSFRLSYYIFWGDINLPCLIYLGDKNNSVMVKSMMGLVFLVIFMGSVYTWVFISVPYFIYLSFLMKVLTLIFITAGIVCGVEVVFLKHFYKNFYKSGGFNYTMFLAGMWNLPILSTFWVSKYSLFMGKFYYLNLDHGWFEYYGSKGSFSFMKSVLQDLQLFFSNNHLKLLLMIVLVYFMSLFMFF